MLRFANAQAVRRRLFDWTTLSLFSITLLLTILSTGEIPSRAQESAEPKSGALSQKEREFAAQFLEEAQNKFFNSISGLSDAQMRYKPSPERWSIAEIAEHIVLAEDQLYGFVTNRLMKTPVAPGAKRSAIADQQVIAATNDRSKQFSANDRGLPTGRWASKEEIIGNFKKTRARTVELIKTTSEDLRHRLAMNPAAGQEIDAFQWLLFAGAHCERHVAQINEVKADAKFPQPPQSKATIHNQEGAEAIVRHLNSAKDKFLASVTGLSDAQLKFKPAADRWSVAEIAEHIVLSEIFLHDAVSNMLKTPGTPEKKSAVPDSVVLQNATDRTNRLQTRDSLQPTGRWGTLKQTLKEFDAARARTLALMKTHRNELRSHFAKFGPLEMDAHQWLLSLAGHSERHTAQINEVKADANFPTK